MAKSSRAKGMVGRTHIAFSSRGQTLLFGLGRNPSTITSAAVGFAGSADEKALSRLTHKTQLGMGLDGCGWSTDE